jgi:NTP pyrophosphatase (non-canonical NTP hydrolase)
MSHLIRPNDYQDLAMRTEADQVKILRRLQRMGPAAMRLLDGVVGLCNDAGEVCTQVKRHVEYGEPLDRLAVLEDCGDVLWRICQVLKGAGWTLEEAMEANLRKLRARYPDGFTDDRAANRDAAAELNAILAAKEAAPARCLRCGNTLPSVFNYCPGGVGGEACVGRAPVLPAPPDSPENNDFSPGDRSGS